jgi:hypothetical protein
LKFQQETDVVTKIIVGLTGYGSQFVSRAGFLGWEYKLEGLTMSQVNANNIEVVIIALNLIYRASLIEIVDINARFCI